MIRKVFVLISLLSAYSNQGAAQSLPLNYYFDPDSHILTTQAFNREGLYDINEIAEVRLEFYVPGYWNLMHQYYNTENYVLADLYYNGEKYDSVGVQFKGQTSYFLVKQMGGSKFSFDIKLDQFKKGQELDGYSTLNFNNAHQDESFMREVIYGSLAGKHIPAARGNYIDLYLNGESWGPYLNIQQVNNDFIREWFDGNDGIRWRADTPVGNNGNPGGPPQAPNWGDGTAALNFLGPDSTLYQKYYTLKSSGLPDPWQYLVNACYILDDEDVPAYTDSLEAYFNLDATLWYLATEILFSDDDSYVYKGKMDYSLYYDPVCKWLQPLEIDGNSVMVMKNKNWDLFYHANDDHYPLLFKLMAIPSIRQRYLAHVRTILADSFNEEAQGKMDNLRSLIASRVQADPKSFTPYFRFDRDVDSLKKFLQVRRDLILNHPEMKVESPKIESLDWETNGPGQLITVSAEATHPDGITEMNLYVSEKLFGQFSKIGMTALGDRFEAILPGYGAGSYIRFYVEAVASNSAGTRSYFPSGAEHEVILLRMDPVVLEDPDVVINELMASNQSTVTDQDGEYEDWIELFNRSSQSVDLSGYSLSDKADNLAKWNFPQGTIIGPGEYLIIWADENGSEEGLHANFKLARSGEELYLVDPELQIVDQVVFGEQETDLAYARVPNGTGDFVIQAATFAANNDTASNTFEISVEGSGLLPVPNPAEGKFRLYSADNTSSTDKFSIFDVYGKEVFKGTFPEESIVDVSNWNPGLYLIRSGTGVQKLVVR